MRNLIVALGALVLVPAGLLAAEIRGTIKSVDPAKNSVIVMVGPKEQMFQCTPKVQVTVLVSTRPSRPRRASVQMQEQPSSLKELTEGTLVTLTTQPQNGTEIVTQIRSEGMAVPTTGGRRRLFR